MSWRLAEECSRTVLGVDLLLDPAQGMVKRAGISVELPQMGFRRTEEERYTIMCTRNHDWYVTREQIRRPATAQPVEHDNGIVATVDLGLGEQPQVVWTGVEPGIESFDDDLIRAFIGEVLQVWLKNAT